MRITRHSQVRSNQAPTLANSQRWAFSTNRLPCVLKALALTTFVLALSLAARGHASAQDAATPPDRSNLARQAYDEGSEHFQAGRFEEALAAFERSYDHQRLPALLFNMGSALDRLNRPEQAIARYEAYLAAMEED